MSQMTVGTSSATYCATCTASSAPRPSRSTSSAKNCCITQLECHAHAMREYAVADECVAHYQVMLVRTKNARRRTNVRKSTV